MSVLVLDAQESKAVYDVAVSVVQAMGARVLTHGQVAAIDRALPHEMNADDFACVPSCRRCAVLRVLY